jgi:hypothetical protein
MRYQLSLESDTDSITGPTFETKEEAINYAELQVNGSYRQEKGYQIAVYDVEAQEHIFVEHRK